MGTMVINVLYADTGHNFEHETLDTGTLYSDQHGSITEHNILTVHLFLRIDLECRLWQHILSHKNVGKKNNIVGHMDT